MNALLAIAVEAALQAGDVIMSIYESPKSDWQIEAKSDNSPLTLADRKAHETIVKALKNTPFPILSEEGAHESYEKRSAWPTLWIVDPLDGTKEFIKRNGEFTVNIALVGNGRPILGVVYAPVLRTIYYASPEDGAVRAAVKAGCHELENAQTLPREDALSNRPYRVVASRSHLSPETQEYIDKLREKHGEVETVCSGSSLKICLVAEGEADVYPRLAPTMEWDTAAGHAVALEAGCELFHAETLLPLTYNKADLHNPWFVVDKAQP